jgi:hypothetical protein
MKSNNWPSTLRNTNSYSNILMAVCSPTTYHRCNLQFNNIAQVNYVSPITNHLPCRLDFSPIHADLVGDDRSEVTCVRGGAVEEEGAVGSLRGSYTRRSRSPPCSLEGEGRGSRGRRPCSPPCTRRTGRHRRRKKGREGAAMEGGRRRIWGARR